MTDTYTVTLERTVIERTTVTLENVGPGITPARVEWWARIMKLPSLERISGPWRFVSSEPTIPPAEIVLKRGRPRGSRNRKPASRKGASQDREEGGEAHAAELRADATPAPVAAAEADAAGADTPFDPVADRPGFLDRNRDA